MGIWYAWLAAFYAAWLLLNFRHDAWRETLAHWPIAAAMALPSYFAVPAQVCQPCARMLSL